MKILHTYCLNYNIGDYALGIGLKNLLRDQLKVDLIGNTNIQGRVFDEYYINEVVNKKYDLLVIGGGGIIHGSHWPNGWFWLIDKDLIKTIKIPFIVYGVGNNYFSDEKIPQKAVEHLKETQKYASFFSVRNDGSYQRVFEQTGIKADIVPDPGFHMELNTEYKRPVEGKYVVVQLANDKTDQRFINSSTKEDFIKSLRATIKKLSMEYKVVLAPHVFDDIELSKEVSNGIPNCEIWDFGYFAFDHSHEALAYYKHAEFVLAMRGHGQIVPIGFGTPVISLQNHPKHGGLMKELGLLDYNVDVRDVDFGKKLNTAVDNVVQNQNELRQQYAVLNEAMSLQAKNALLKISKSIKA